MITHLFYYESYKPYIIEENENKKRKMSSAKEYLIFTSTKMEKSFSYFLNKSSKKEIANYVFKVASGFNDIKNTSHYLALRLDNRVNIRNVIEDSSKKINSLSKAYNDFLDFYNTDETAQSNFSLYIDSLKTIIYENQEILSGIGINIVSGDFLQVDKDYIEQNLLTCSKNILNNLKYVFDLIYQRTCGNMKDSLIDYMTFKDFSYYFNYSIYNDSKKSFPLLTNGLLLKIDR